MCVEGPYQIMMGNVFPIVGHGQGNLKDTDNPTP